MDVYCGETVAHLSNCRALVYETAVLLTKVLVRKAKALFFKAKA